MRDEAKALLQNERQLRALGNKVKALLPPDTDFGLFLIVPVPGDPESDGQVLSITTDDDLLLAPVARWVNGQIAAGRGMAPDGKSKVKLWRPEGGR